MHMISVVLTTYNRKYEVRRALDSVYGQTKPPYEVILVDDCSEDDTEKYINSFNFKNLKYYRLPKRSGPGVARNYGIKQASGDYIAFLDSDNEWKHTKLEEFLNVLEMQETEWDVVYSKYKKHNKFDVEVHPRDISELCVQPKDEIFIHNPTDASSTMYKKSFLEQIGFFSEDLLTNIDWELLLRGNKKQVVRMCKVDKVLTENWTMFDGISEDKELEHRERMKIYSEFASDFFAVITENYKQLEQHYIQEKRRYEETELFYKNLLARKDSFYKLMSKWMKIKLEGQSLANELCKKGYKTIAIYGAGKHGTFLYQDLKESAVEVAYFIDRNKDAIQVEDIDIYALDQELPKVDAIVVSPYLEIEMIKKELEHWSACDIIALNDLVEW